MHVRDAVRQLLREPHFTCVVVATLGLGIAATSAVYAVVDAIYLKPLPFDRPDSIVTVEVRSNAGGRFGISAGTMEAVRGLPVVERAAVSIGSERTLTGAGTARLVSGEAVSREYFAVFGIRAALGRTLSEADSPDDAPVVLSHNLWREAFGSAPDAIGRQIHLDGAPHTIVGVMPATFKSLEGSRFWTVFRPRAGDLTRELPAVTRAVQLESRPSQNDVHIVSVL